MEVFRTLIKMQNCRKLHKLKLRLGVLTQQHDHNHHMSQILAGCVMATMVLLAAWLLEVINPERYSNIPVWWN
jgi:hypothetical protein